MRVSPKGRMADCMSRHCARFPALVVIGYLGIVILTGCFGTPGLKEITGYPYPLIYQDDSIARFESSDHNVFVEVRKTPSPRPLEHLAVHYASLFPGGEIVKPGDREEYRTIKGKNAYKVVFRTKYIRKRKRLDKDSNPKSSEIPEGWTKAQMSDPTTGDVVPVLHGPVIPQQKILYLVQGESHIYYILLTADGDAITPATEKLEQFVRNDIKFH